jgi:hypothetical protein
VASNNPLNNEGRSYWAGVVQRYEQKKFELARINALDFAEWLDEKYQKSDPLQFDDESYSVLYRGIPFVRLRPLSYVILKVLFNRYGSYLAAETIIAAINAGGAKEQEPTMARLQPFPDGAAGRKRISRAINHLPEQLRDLIDGQEGVGRCLVLPPQ